MPLTHLLPGEGIWELRLNADNDDPGIYFIALYDKKVATQGGPFPLRFPSPTYALQWFDSLIIEGTREPIDDEEAEHDLLHSFISAKGEATTWGPIVNALFHSAHSGPHLASPWWYGSLPPFVPESPLAPAPSPPQSSDRALGWVQLFTDIDSGTVVGIRKQIGDEQSPVQFLWLADGIFTPEMPRELGGGRQFTIYGMDAEYVEILIPLLDGGLVFPKAASPLLSITPSTLLSSEDSPLEIDELVGSLLNGLHAHSMTIEAGAAAVHMKSWLSGNNPVSAHQFLEWLITLIVHVNQGSSESPPSHPTHDSFHEVLVGPEGDFIFALHSVDATWMPEEHHWHVDDHFWRYNKDWDGDFPEYGDDWRWLAENSRLEDIPEIVHEIQQQRELEEEFMLAWDVSDSFRIGEEYVDAFTQLFDRAISIPAQLAHWLSTPADEVINPEKLNQRINPLYQLALTALSKATKQSLEAPPQTLLAPLKKFIIEREPVTARDMTNALMRLIGWFADSESETSSEAEPQDSHELQISQPRINPNELLGVDKLVKFTAALIALTDDVVVINVESARYPDGVYVQICREDDGALSLEAVSSKYLDSPLTPDEISTLHSLGWEDPRDEDLPNYTRYLEARETSPGEVAEFLVKTLHLVYGTKPSDLHQFAPEHVVRALLKGEHGPELAMNPDLSDARKARLFLGLSFPHDLAAAGG